MSIKAIFRQFPQLESKNLILRNISLTDVNDIYTIYSNPEVTKYYNIDTFTNIRDAYDLIKNFLSRFKYKKGIRWGIVKRGSNHVIGTCGYNSWINHSYRGEIGYDLAKDYWNQGIMTEALGLIHEYGFYTINLNRIEALVIPENNASINVLKKLGFQEEGTLREWGFWKDNFHTVKIFSLLRKGYLSKKYLINKI